MNILHTEREASLLTIPVPVEDRRSPCLSRCRRRRVWESNSWQASTFGAGLQQPRISKTDVWSRVWMNSLSSAAPATSDPAREPARGRFAWACGSAKHTPPFMTGCMAELHCGKGSVANCSAVGTAWARMECRQGSPTQPL